MLKDLIIYITFIDGKQTIMERLILKKWPISLKHWIVLRVFKQVLLGMMKMDILLTPHLPRQGQKIFFWYVVCHLIDTFAFKFFFQAIDKNNDGSLTLDEFLSASSRMSEILKRQDALEQRKKLTCLLFMSPIIQKHNDFSKVIIRFCNLQARVFQVPNQIFHFSWNFSFLFLIIRVIEALIIFC